MPWRLGLDLGAGSLGWCAFQLDQQGRPTAILAAGTRIFGDGRESGREGTPRAVNRRDARSARRRLDRFKRRRAALIKYLIQDGLFPADESERKALENLDPYEVRALALDQIVPLSHLGRALFHLDQRRGFQSNRKTDRQQADDNGKIATGVTRLADAMAQAGARTVGEFLHLRRQQAVDDNQIPSVRTRLRPETGADAKGDGYDFYPSRALIKDEFQAIWDAQQPHYPDILTPQLHDRLHEIIFYQRPLKTPQVGTCTLVAGEERLPKAHPLFQRRRLLEEVNALRIVRPGQLAQPLTMEQRDLLLQKLAGKKKVSFETLRKTLKLDPAARFNKESDRRPDLIGDEVAAELGDKKRFGPRWFHLSPDQQAKIVARLQEDEDDAALTRWLMDHHGLDADHAKATLAARLPEGHGRFGLTATNALILAMQAQVIVYSDAVEQAGLGHHSDFRDGVIHADLPYYGVPLERHLLPGSADANDPDDRRIGRLTNPTVHIGLNQLRRVVNALIRRFGRPDEIAVEITRDLKSSQDEKARRNRENNDNRIQAEGRSKKLQDLNQPDTGANRARLKLWEELNHDNILDRRCIYSGEQISPTMLFSDQVEIDHILPFALTLDDSNANKILCLREANRHKRRNTPFAAWGHTDKWPGIAERASRLPKEKRWRFEPDAMEKFQEKGGFQARHLVDTQYLSRLAHEYLASLYPEKGEGSSHVWVSPGRLTEMVRRKLRLNELLPDHNFSGGAGQPKNRLDHRHHAIDAAVVGIIDRGLLQQVAKASGELGEAGREHIAIPEPWDGFRDDLYQVLAAMTVSHRPDHGTIVKTRTSQGQDSTAGKLHNDTAYGLTGEKNERGIGMVVHRVALSALKSPGDLAKIRDEDLKNALIQATDGLKDKAFAAAIAAFPRSGPAIYRGIRRVRLKEALSVIPIHDRTGKPYKGVKGDSNYRFDVWELPDGRWEAETISMFHAHQPGWISRIRQETHNPRKVLSLHQNDMVALTDANGSRRIMLVSSFSQNGQITLVEPHESGDLRKRNKSDDDPFRTYSPTSGGLKKMHARQIRVDELGRVMDPGFPPSKPRK